MKYSKIIMTGAGALTVGIIALLALTRSATGHDPSPAMLSTEMLAEDFAVFRTALEEAHPGIYRYTPKTEFDALFDTIAASLDTPMTEQEFYRALNPAIVALRCGHTKFHPERNFATPYHYALETQLPLVLFVAGERAWVRADLSTPPVLPIGAELLSIDGTAMAAIIDELVSRATFADGLSLGAKELELTTYFSAYYSTFIDSGPNHTVTYRAPEATETATASLTGIPHEAHMAWQEAQASEAPPLELSYPDEATALLTIRSFWFESREVNFERFLREAFQEIADRGIDHLIIDLRDNEGGKDAYGALLYAYLTDGPFDYYDRITVTQRRPFSFREHARLPWYFPLYRALIAEDADGTFIWPRHSNLREQEPQSGTFHGDVIVLINGRSFSVTSEFAAIAKANHRAIFIGQETGGGYRGNNSGFFAIVTLPNSHLVVGIPLWGYYTAVPDPETNDGGVRPDIEITRTFEDVLQGRDPELERALELVTER